GADVDAFHEAVIGAELGVRSQRFAIVHSSAGPVDLRDADHALEVEDRGLVQVWSDSLEVEQDGSVGSSDSGAVRNWYRSWGAAGFGRKRHPDTGRDHRPAGHPARRKELTPRQGPFPEVRVALLVVGNR